jgi:hypothetical protein
MPRTINLLIGQVENLGMSPKRWSESRESLRALGELAEREMGKRSAMWEMELGVEAEKRALGSG